MAHLARLLVALGLGTAAFAVVILLGAAHATEIAAQAPAGDPEKGRYIFQAAGGCGCHGPNLAGYRAGGPPLLPASAPFGELFAGPFGEVPAPNITPDRETGIGGWTDEQLIAAIRDGVRPNGERLFPIMPWAAFHFMADEDVRNLVAYLRTVPAVNNPVPERRLNGPVPPAPQLPPSPQTAPASGVERGRYLTVAVSDCGGCHTPPSPQGGPDMSKMLAGNFIPRAPGEFQLAPNITPHPQVGIGTWTEQQIATLIKTGVRPNGTRVTGLMAEVVEHGFKSQTDEDALAIAAYLKTIPPVSERPTPPGPPPAAPAPATPAPPAEAAPISAPTPQQPVPLPRTGGLPLLPLALGALALSAAGLALRRIVR